MNNVNQRQLTPKITKSTQAELGSLVIRLRYIKHVKVSSIKVKKKNQKSYDEKKRLIFIQQMKDLAYRTRFAKRGNVRMTVC